MVNDITMPEMSVRSYENLGHYFRVLPRLGWPATLAATICRTVASTESRNSLETRVNL